MVDYGDCSFDPGFSDAVAGVITAGAGRIIESGVFWLSMGGDHLVSYLLFGGRCR